MGLHIPAIPPDEGEAVVPVLKADCQPTPKSIHDAGIHISPPFSLSKTCLLMNENLQFGAASPQAFGLIVDAHICRIEDQKESRYENRACDFSE
jgi:hypothetical protein